MDGVEPCAVEALAFEQVQQTRRTPLRADHAEVFRHRPAENFAQTVRVVAVAARDDRDVIALPDADFLDGCREQVAIDRVRLREARPVREGRAVVRYRNLKAEVGGIPTERLRDIAAAEQNQPLVRQKIARQLPALRLKAQRRRQTALRPLSDFAELL